LAMSCCVQLRAPVTAAPNVNWVRSKSELSSRSMLG
jgi:hypothetical protein